MMLDEADHVRFVHDLFIFNDRNDVDPNHRFREPHPAAHRVRLVDIHAYCLMPNHYHVLVSEVEDGGISLFMRKLNMGYAKYFNEKYERSGVLWQGTFKKIHMERDAHFLYIPYYIHLNPLDLTHPKWREGKILNVEKAFKSLTQYRWSSFLDYNGVRNFPSVLNQDLLSDVLGSKIKQKSVIRDIISNFALASTSMVLE